MSPPPESTLAGAEQIIAELQCELAACRADLGQRTAERDEALAQQVATAEVLQVINSSPGDLAPVFDAILEKAHNLCGAAHGSLTVYDSERFYAVATRGMPESFSTLLRQPRPASRLHTGLLDGERFVHLADMKAVTPGPDDEVTPVGAGQVGIRTLLFVPLRKDRALLGYIAADRRELTRFGC